MTRPTWDNDGAARTEFMSPAGRAVCFALFVGGGMVTLAAVVLLPEYAALAELRAHRDTLAHQLECEAKLAVYNGRLIRAIQNDPVLAARLLMRHGNFRPVGCETIGTDADAAGPTVPARLKQEAMTPPARPPDALCAAGHWLDHRHTRLSLLALAIGATAVGMILFSPRRSSRRG